MAEDERPLDTNDAGDYESLVLQAAWALATASVPSPEVLERLNQRVSVDGVDLALLGGSASRHGGDPRRAITAGDLEGMVRKRRRRSAPAARHGSRQPRGQVLH
ncbi:MAG: hypothetical protein ACXV3V_04510 [Actinomycetes bacterium]